MIAAIGLVSLGLISIVGTIAAPAREIGFLRAAGLSIASVGSVGLALWILPT